MRPTFETMQSDSAEILKADGLQPVGVSEAMGKVREALSKGHSTSRNVYAVIVHGKHRVQGDSNYLSSVNTFLEAYWRGWRTLSRLANTHHSSPQADHLQMIRDREAGDICIYWGSASAKDVKEKMSTSPGVYVIPSHLDVPLLVSLGLPPLPELFRQLPLVMQVEMTDTLRDQGERTDRWNPWESLTRLVTGEERANEEIERDTLKWRNQFLSEYESWTSAQVARESTSTAKNQSAIASRWLAEGRIFSVRFGGKTLFPRFQFQDGNPIPAVSRVIKAFPKHATGWSFAFFFTTPNSYIGGHKPLELLKADPVRLESLARSFANPADAF
jgi:hypothetical protein